MSPLLSFILPLRHIRAAKDILAATLIGVIALYSVMTVSMCSSERMAEMAMARHHLALEFPHWAAIQLVPGMYNHENRVAVLQPGTSNAPRPRLVRAHWINHHSAREMFEAYYRNKIAKIPGCLGYRLQSVFQEQPLITLYEMCREKGIDVIRRIEAKTEP